MVTTTLRVLLTVCLSAGMFAGCSVSGGPANPPIRGTGTTVATRVDLAELPPDQLVFQVSWSYGLMMQANSLAARPALTVYANGEVYVAAERTGSYWPGRPGSFDHGTIGRSQLEVLLGEAVDSGLFDRADFGEPQITDIGPSTVLLRAGTGPAKVVETLALNIVDADDVVSGPQRRNREALRALVDRFEDAVSAERDEWTPTRVDVTELRTTSGSDSGAPWPGPHLDQLLTVPTSWGRCGVAEGAMAAKLYDAALENGSTRWTVDGDKVDLVVRPLLPKEQACHA